MKVKKLSVIEWHQFHECRVLNPVQGHVISLSINFLGVYVVVFMQLHHIFLYFFLFFIITQKVNTQQRIVHFMNTYSRNDKSTFGSLHMSISFKINMSFRVFISYRLSLKINFTCEKTIFRAVSTYCTVFEAFTELGVRVLPPISMICNL